MSDTKNASNNELQLIPWTNFNLPPECQSFYWQGLLPKDTHGVLLSAAHVATIAKHIPQLEIDDLPKRGWHQDEGIDYCLDITQGSLQLYDHPCGYWTVELISEDKSIDDLVTHLLTYLSFGPALFSSPTDAARVAEEVFSHSDDCMYLHWRVQLANYPPSWSLQLLPAGAPFHHNTVKR